MQHHFFINIKSIINIIKQDDDNHHRHQITFIYSFFITQVETLCSIIFYLMLSKASSSSTLSKHI